MTPVELTSHSEKLRADGYTVVDGLFSSAALDAARMDIAANKELLRNTRPNPTAGHLAGFHRYPELEHLHAMISTNRAIRSILRQAARCTALRSIGLSDITVNRSQEWHVDLLRGKYTPHLNADLCWGASGGGVYKVLLYLQPGSSLQVRGGAHTVPVPLDEDRKCEPDPREDVQSIKVGAGAVVLMDIRLPHRGNSEADLGRPELAMSPKILISTVLGGDRMPLTDAMEVGNFQRLLDWESRHKIQGKVPKLWEQELNSVNARA